VFRAEVPQLGSIVERLAHGRIIDLACGTGFWLPCYAGRCSSITMFDQSERMLDECRKKIVALGITDRCSLVRGDFFDYEFDRGAYDVALVGFFLSHLTEAQEPILFGALTSLLDSSGQFLILDSAWSDERARFNAKSERQERRLNDGTHFEVYKRYCSREDIAGWAKQYGLTLVMEHFGTAFCAISGRFAHGVPPSET
jgi:demethylmenaquinone methyltransferase/2-methoxy-6-polyprenyl-1,4-benzoquinol methylase